MARLRTATTAREPEAACAAAMAAMAGDAPPSDDVALLILRRQPRARRRPSPAPAGSYAMTRPTLKVPRPGRHVVVTAPAEIDLTTATQPWPLGHVATAMTTGQGDRQRGPACLPRPGHEAGGCCCGGYRGLLVAPVTCGR
jgi:hypothetical protein